MFKPIPEVAYDKMKGFLLEHMWLHYMAHNTFCFLKKSINQNYTAYTPKEWMTYHINRKIRWEEERLGLMEERYSRLMEAHLEYSSIMERTDRKKRQGPRP